MPNVLFVKANDRPTDQSVSVKMYELFLQSYKEVNPSDEIIELDLFQENLPHYGNTEITGVAKKNRGIELTTEEEKAVNLIDKYLTQFLSMDKIVFAFPLWNKTVPTPLTTYIAYLTQAGKMFNYTENGPVGYAGDKKVMILNARGGDYSLDMMAPAEMAVGLVKNIINIWGIKSPEEVIIEGHHMYSEKSEEIIATGLENVIKAASKF